MLIPNRNRKRIFLRSRIHFERTKPLQIPYDTIFRITKRPAKALSPRWNWIFRDLYVKSHILLDLLQESR